MGKNEAHKMIDYTYIKDLESTVRNTTKTTEPIWSDMTDVVFQRTDPERNHNNNCVATY